MMQTLDSVTIYSAQGVEKLTTNVNEGCVRKLELMKEDYITLKFSLVNAIEFNVGDYCDTPYGRFCFTKPYKPQYNEDTGAYDYSLQLNSDIYLWNNRLLKLRPQNGAQESSFVVTNYIGAFVQIIQDNIDANGWKYHDENGEHDYVVVVTEIQGDFEAYDRTMKTISFSNVGVLDACTQIAETFECEWWKNGHEICFGRCEVDKLDESNNPVEVVFDDSNMVKMTPSESNGEYFNRLYVFGGTTNIPVRYRKRLVFDVKEVKYVTNIEHPTNYAGRWQYEKGENGEDLTYIGDGSFYQIVDTSRIISPINISTHDKVAEPVIPIIQRSNFAIQSIIWTLGDGDTVISTFASNIFPVLPKGEYSVTGNGKLALSVTHDDYKTDNVQTSVYIVLRYKVQEVDGVEPKDVTDYIWLTPKSVFGEGDFIIDESTTFEITHDKAVGNITLELVVESKSSRGTSARAEITNNDLTVKIQGKGDNSPCNVKVTFISGNLAGQTVDGILNNGYYNGETNIITIPSAIPIGVGDRYTIDNIIRGRVPVWYFEDYNTTDVVINGTVEKRLMLPESFNDGKNYIEPQDIAEEGEDIEPTPDAQIVEGMILADDVIPESVFEVNCYYSYKTKVKDEETGKETGALQTYYLVAVDGFTEDMILEGKTLEMKFTESQKLAGLKFGVEFRKKGYSWRVGKDVEELVRRIYRYPSGIIDNGYADYEVTDNPDIEKDTFIDCYLTEDCLEIILTEEYQTPMPNEFYFPEIGDKFTLEGWDASMWADTNLVTEAEERLLEYGKKVLKKSMIDPTTYTCVPYMRYAKNNALPLGQKVTLYNDVYFKSGTRNSRVIGFEFPLDIPWDNPKYIVGEYTEYGRIAAIEGKLKELEINGSKYMGAVTGGGRGSNVYLIKSGDKTPPTDNNVYSAKRANSRFFSKEGDEKTSFGLEVGGRFVAGANANIGGELIVGDKIVVQGEAEIHDRATFNREAQFNQPVYFGDYSEGMSGRGALITQAGKMECDEAIIRKSLIVPELQYNRTEVYVGNQWRSFGAGKIKSVVLDKDIDGYLMGTGTIYLKLEEGEIGQIALWDKCQGIFHNFDNPAGNDTENTDDGKGNFTFAGFYTSYFIITEVSTAEDEDAPNVRNNVARFKLRRKDDNSGWYNGMYPCEQMTFVAYANDNDETRRVCRYSTLTYERYLVNMRGWEIQKENIAAQFGDLSNLSVFDMDMTGYSAYLNNIYFSGFISQIEDSVKVYTADLTEYISDVEVDTEGNIIGGLYNEDGQGNRQYRIYSSVTVRNMDTILTLADEDEETSKGTYKMYIHAFGCEAVMQNGTVYVTSIDGLKNEPTDVVDKDEVANLSSCYVEIMLDCEGETTLVRALTIRIGHKGTDGTSVTITEQNVAYALGENGTQAPTGGWTVNIPSVENGKYLWSRTYTQYSDGNETTTYSVSRMGIDGKGIQSSVVYYSLKENQQDPDTITDWSTSYPDNLIEGYWLYVKTSIVYSDNNTTASYSVSKIGTGAYYAGLQEYYTASDSATEYPTAGQPFGKDDTDTFKQYDKNEDIGGIIYSPWVLGVRPELTSEAPYLWNISVSFDSAGNKFVTRPVCVGDLARGIVSVVETYAISASGTMDNGNPPSDIVDADWTDEQNAAAPTADKPYQWNKTVTTYTRADANGNTTSTIYHVSAVRGSDASQVQPNILEQTMLIQGKMSQWLNKNGNVYGTTDILVSEKYEGRNIVRITAEEGGTSYHDIRQILQDKLEPSTWYTFSVYLRPNAPMATHITNCVDTTAGVVVDGVKQTSVSADLGLRWVPDGWNFVRHTVTFKTKSEITGIPTLYIRVYNAGQVVNGTALSVDGFCDISMPKIERGEVATAYLPNENELIGKDGINGVSSFKSTVFKRSNLDLAAPSGGTYANPVPTDGSGWTDEIPSGESILWATTRIFTMDGSAPQQNEWTTPVRMITTSNFKVKYYLNPILPDDTDPDNGSDWVATPSSEAWYMATSTATNGVWTDWTVTQIKGEKGLDGADGSSVKVVEFKDNYIPLASNAIWQEWGQAGYIMQDWKSAIKPIANASAFKVGDTAIIAGKRDDATHKTMSLYAKVTATASDTLSTTSLYIIESGDAGISSYVSTVFRRAASKPTKPTGGSYDNPHPAESVWSDGIPDGELTLWASTCRFSTDVEYVSEWTDPYEVSSSSDIEMKFSSVASNPGTPETTPSNWVDTASSDAIWMAVRKLSGNTWSAWEVIKVKGEDGKAASQIQNNILEQTLLLTDKRDLWLLRDNGSWGTFVTLGETCDGREVGRLRVTEGKESYNDVRQLLTGKLMPSTWYTFSVYLRPNAPMATHITNCVDTTAGVVVDGVKQTSVSADLGLRWVPDGWNFVRHTVTFKTKSEITGTPTLYIRVFNAGQNILGWTSTSEGFCDFSMPKIERGEVATAYMPNENEMQGTSIRGPQKWETLPIGYGFQAGGLGDNYQDIVMVGTDYFYCKKRHTKTASSPSPKNDSTNWKQGSKIDMVATDIMLAKYSLIENLGVTAIEMYKKNSDGSLATDENGAYIPVLLAKDGNLSCKGVLEATTMKLTQAEEYKGATESWCEDRHWNDATIHLQLWNPDFLKQPFFGTAFLFHASAAERTYILPDLALGEVRELTIFVGSAPDTSYDAGDFPMIRLFTKHEFDHNAIKQYSDDLQDEKSDFLATMEDSLPVLENPSKTIVVNHTYDYEHVNPNSPVYYSTAFEILLCNDSNHPRTGIYKMHGARYKYTTASGNIEEDITIWVVEDENKPIQVRRLGIEYTDDIDQRLRYLYAYIKNRGTITETSNTLVALTDDEVLNAWGYL